jgi:hypothetical protein
MDDDFMSWQSTRRALAMAADLGFCIHLGVDAVYVITSRSIIKITSFREHPWWQVQPLKISHQLQVLANLALSSHDIAFNIALIFFGLTCLVNGYLIFRSGYLPKFVGVLMQIAGLSYLTACFASLFAPAFADLITPAILLPPLIGELSFCLWLLIKGVNIAKWHERVNASQGTAAGRLT